MSEREILIKAVSEAYEHLYDQVYLRTCPLVQALDFAPSLTRKETAWQLHQMLLDLIDELNPGPQAPTFSREWRRHHLMVLRYEQGLDPQAIADQLAVSRRHYYRLHETAIEAIADLLRDRRRLDNAAPALSTSGDDEPDLTEVSMELLRLEVARVAQTDRFSRPSDVIDAAVGLLHERMSARDVQIAYDRLHALPIVSVGSSLLRQIVIGILTDLVDRSRSAVIEISSRSIDTMIELSLRVTRPGAVRSGDEGLNDESLTEFEVIAGLSGIHILSLHSGSAIVGFNLQLPTVQQQVLIVDDNEDILRLYSSYLAPYGYRVIAVRNGREALDRAEDVQPFAIVLDLMMPEMDGWDVLQRLLNQPDTQNIPVIVCSVLRQQKDLALTVGAAAFLAKPVTEQLLLSTLAALDEAQGTGTP